MPPWRRVAAGQHRPSIVRRRRCVERLAVLGRAARSRTAATAPGSPPRAELGVVAGGAFHDPGVPVVVAFEGGGLDPLLSVGRGDVLVYRFVPMCGKVTMPSASLEALAADRGRRPAACRRRDGQGDLVGDRVLTDIRRAQRVAVNVGLISPSWSARWPTKPSKFASFASGPCRPGRCLRILRCERWRQGAGSGRSVTVKELFSGR